MIFYHALHFDQRPQSPCSHTQRRPMLVRLAHFANRGHTAYCVHSTSAPMLCARPSVFPRFPQKTATLPAHPIEIP
jgi:hypothetical protein